MFVNLLGNLCGRSLTLIPMVSRTLSTFPKRVLMLTLLRLCSLPPLLFYIDQGMFSGYRIPKSDKLAVSYVSCIVVVRPLDLLQDPSRSV